MSWRWTLIKWHFQDHRVDYAWENGYFVAMVKDSKRPSKTVAPSRPVEGLIHVIRGRKVVLDSDLAKLYEVTTKAFNQAIRRNIERFPEDFMFQLSHQEAGTMRSQIVTASKRNIRFQPLAFTEHGVAMLSAVLKSQRAIETSISVIRAFVRMRELMLHNKDIAARVEKLERGLDRTASVIHLLVEDIDRLAHEVKEMKALPTAPKRKIGFKLGED
jgi:hypothetical protein